MPTFWGNYDVTSGFGSPGFLQRNNCRNNIGHKKLIVQRFGNINCLILLCQNFLLSQLLRCGQVLKFLVFIKKGSSHSTLPNELSQLLQLPLHFIQGEQKLIDPITQVHFSHVKRYSRFAFFEKIDRAFLE